MKNSILLFFTLLVFLPVQAIDIKEVWASMPDSIVGYLDKNKRMVLLDHVELGTQAEVENKLHDRTRLDTIAVDRMQLTLNETTTLTLRLFTDNRSASTTGVQLPPADRSSDSYNAICLIQTFGSECPESTISIYDTEWHLLREILLQPQELMTPSANMTPEQLQEVLQLAPVVFIQAELEGDDLRLTPSFPYNTHEGKKKLNGLFSQTNVNFKDKVLNKSY